MIFLLRGKKEGRKRAEAVEEKGEGGREGRGGKAADHDLAVGET